MATETNLGKIHVFPSMESYEDNQSSVSSNDVALVPISSTVVETYRNGRNWYRVWGDGYVEQGGVCTTTGTVTFLKPYADSNFVLVYGNSGGDSQSRTARPISGTNAANGFTVANGTQKGWQGWYAFGLGASE